MGRLLGKTLAGMAASVAVAACSSGANTAVNRTSEGIDDAALTPLNDLNDPADEGYTIYVRDSFPDLS